MESDLYQPKQRNIIKTTNRQYFSLTQQTNPRLFYPENAMRQIIYHSLFQAQEDPYQHKQDYMQSMK